MFRHNIDDVDGERMRPQIVYNLSQDLEAEWIVHKDDAWFRRQRIFCRIAFNNVCPNPKMVRVTARSSRQRVGKFDSDQSGESCLVGQNHSSSFAATQINEGVTWNVIHCPPKQSWIDCLITVIVRSNSEAHPPNGPAGFNAKQPVKVVRRGEELTADSVHEKAQHSTFPRWGRSLSIKCGSRSSNLAC